MFLFSLHSLILSFSLPLHLILSLSDSPFLPSHSLSDSLFVSSTRTLLLSHSLPLFRFIYNSFSSLSLLFFLAFSFPLILSISLLFLSHSLPLSLSRFIYVPLSPFSLPLSISLSYFCHIHLLSHSLSSFSLSHSFYPNLSFFLSLALFLSLSMPLYNYLSSFVLSLPRSYNFSLILFSFVLSLSLISSGLSLSLSSSFFYVILSLPRIYIFPLDLVNIWDLLSDDEACTAFILEPHEPLIALLYHRWRHRRPDRHLLSQNPSPLSILYLLSGKDALQDHQTGTKALRVEWFPGESLSLSLSLSYYCSLRTLRSF